MKKIVSFVLILMLAGAVSLSFTACKKENDEMKVSGNQGIGYIQITPEEAKKIMDSESGYVILDTREQDEFDEGHIKGAMLIPYDKIEERAEEELKDKSQLILVYCRSGRRSKIAAQSLADMGYTNVKEFGGIIDWPYETVK